MSLKTVRPESLALWLAGGVPFALYAATASGHSYWLDSGEFVAAAVQLGIPHPPGHPLSELLGAAIALLPLGALDFRVALGQAIVTGAASMLHCRASAAVMRGLGLPAHVLWPLSVFAAWLSAFTYGIWFQAVRPEVYALQTLCVAAVFERLAAFAEQPADGDLRPLLGAGLALGLGLANHHLIAFLLVPAFIPAVWRVWRARRSRIFAGACALGTLGLGTYVYLPLRAAANPAINLGNPSSPERFYWVISAQVYAQNLIKQEQQPLLDRALDVIVLLIENFHALPLLMAVSGLYLLARHPGTRQHAFLCAWLLFCDAGVRAWLGPVRANPDILGYLAPSLLVVGTLTAGCLAACAWMLLQRRLPQLAAATALAPLCALALLPGSYARASLRDFAATDAFDELRVRRLPARAIVISSMFQTVFRAWDLEAVEHARPDTITVPLPFLRYPGVSDALVARHPELSDLIRSYLSHHDHLQAQNLIELARTRPVFVELDTRVAPELYRLLRPRGLFTQVLAQAEPVSRSVLQRELSTAHTELSQLVASDTNETETARQQLWVHYMNALHLAALSERALANMEIGYALALYPQDRRARELAAALQAARAPDIRHFQDF